MPLTWCFPCIGHMGITDSKGIIYDFQGPYFIQVIAQSYDFTLEQQHKSTQFILLQSDDMMLGPATRYMRLDPNEIRADVPDASTAAEAWDLCVQKVRVHKIDFSLILDR